MYGLVLNHAVSKLLSQTTLDIIGKASLGVDLGSLSTESSTFHHLYDQLLNLPPIGAIVFLLNIFFPVRPWIPLKANRDFMHASSEVRRLLLETIRKRKTEVFANGNVRSDFAEEGEGQDYLTFMIREKGVGKDKWSDEEILGHVSSGNLAIHEKRATDRVLLAYELHVCGPRDHGRCAGLGYTLDVLAP
jgi:cytochrome P450